VARPSLSQTVLPTDTAPLPTKHRGPSYVKLNATELRVLKDLPADFYLNFTNESSFRLETNPFQDPPRSSLLSHLSGATPLYPLSASQQQQIGAQLADVNVSQQIFREQPNLTAGWEFSPRNHLYFNYFYVRDSLLQSTILNSNTHSVGPGWQYDIPIGKKWDLQPNFQIRELFQTRQPNLFDYLPAVTLSRSMGANSVAYVNTILQLRGRQPFVAPNTEIDPFYTVGFLYRKGPWQAIVSGTLNQNFRTMFGQNAIAPTNNYLFICDFELSRQIHRYKGVHAFVRLEPLWNAHSNAAPGFSGFDFRLFYGLRVSFNKPAIGSKMRQLQEEIKSGKPTQSSN
jgi:hypothetical protein